MMQKTRRAFLVYVDLDPVPGTFHTQESAQNNIKRILDQAIGHYNPIVSLAPIGFQPNTALLVPPTTWEAITGIKIHNADGWGRPVKDWNEIRHWDEPISMSEFHARAAVSTCDFSGQKI